MPVRFCQKEVGRTPKAGVSSNRLRVVGHPSGQRGWTVNLLAYAFDGSNPSPTTIFIPLQLSSVRIAGAPFYAKVFLMLLRSLLIFLFLRSTTVITRTEDK